MVIDDNFFFTFFCFIIRLGVEIVRLLILDSHWFRFVWLALVIWSLVGLLYQLQIRES